MKITEAQLRQIIREAIIECYGWPVEEEKPLYGVKAKDDVSPRDPKNPELKFPKGLNTRSPINVTEAKVKPMNPDIDQQDDEEVEEGHVVPGSELAQYNREGDGDGGERWDTP